MENKKEIDYVEINRQSWNSRTDVHYDSAFYDNDSFIKGRSSLKEIEARLLGKLAGKTALHLQCHFGQDTISLGRLGAKSTGVDLSDRAIARARELATLTGSDARFICCDIYDLPQHLDEQFDLVFSSYGTIGWLPDLNQWAGIVSRYLKPGGQFVFAEFHPVAWMFDDDFKKISYRYFKSEPIVEKEEGTYADRQADISPETVSWNHGLGEVLNSLLHNGLEVVDFQEYDYSPYNCFNETIESEPGKFRIKHLEDKIPLAYSIVATKKSALS